jgi:SpoVK/Ycf46/Vps4 family AAA+-type ATPase
LRSGRVELWLQTKLPDEAARAGILRRWVGDAFAEIGAPDFARIAAVTQSYTPADLRRVVGDAKLLCAADVAASQPLESATTYLERAVEDLSAARWRMADLRSDENIRIGGQPKGKYALGVGGLSEIGVGCKMNGW